MSIEKTGVSGRATVLKRIAVPYVAEETVGTGDTLRTSQSPLLPGRGKMDEQFYSPWEVIHFKDSKAPRAEKSASTVTRA